MKVLIYALGGGWGHVTRAAALATALRPAETSILANSPYCGIVREAMPGLSIESIGSREEAVARVATSKADVLVVDTFPRGLGGELAALLPTWKGKTILVHRDLSPEYVRWARGIREFVEAQYDLVLCPGEAGPFSDLPQARMTGGWIVREPVELEDPPSPIVICAAGNPDELGWYEEVAALLPPGDVRCVGSAPGWIHVWPAIDWIARARVVIGGAGYNTINECLATGTPLIAKPWARKYDRQRERAQCAGVTIVETPAEAARSALEILKRPVRDAAPRVYPNGAVEASARLRELLPSA